MTRLAQQLQLMMVGEAEGKERVSFASDDNGNSKLELLVFSGSFLNNKSRSIINNIQKITTLRSSGRAPSW